MITATVAADIVSYNDNLTVSVVDPNTTYNEKAYPKNGANGIIVDNVTGRLGDTTTALTRPCFAAIAGISSPNTFKQTTNNNSPYLKGGVQARNTRPGAAKSRGEFGVVGDCTTNATVTTTATLQLSPDKSLRSLNVLEWITKERVDKFRRGSSTIKAKVFAFKGWD